MYSLIFSVYHVINTINNSVVLFRKNVETKLHVQITLKLGSDYQISVWADIRLFLISQHATAWILNMTKCVWADFLIFQAFTYF